MPLIKHDGPSVSREELAQIRSQLDAPYKFHRLERDDQRLLFVRTPRADPDPVSDLEACLERVPAWGVVHLDHLFLLGAQTSLHVPASIFNPLLQRRRTVDAAAVEGLRRRLDPNYGATILKILGDPENLLRLGLRLPRARCSDFTETDLRRLARSVGPWIDDGSVRDAAVAYLVADEDHVRMLGSEVLSDLEPRWVALRQEPPREAPAPPPIEKPVRARPRPRSVAPRAPAGLDLETHVHALAPEAHGPESIEAALAILETRLLERTFHVRRHVDHGTHSYALAAERGHGYPRRIVVRVLPRFGREDAVDCIREVERIGADLLLVVTPDPDEDAARRTIATRVKILTPRDTLDVAL